MKGKLFLFIGFVVVSIVLTGCKKIDDEIIGVWYYQTYSNVPQEQVTCSFLENGEMITILQLNGNQYADTCKYTVIQTVFKKQIIISESNGLSGIASFDGTYKVYRYRRDILKMNRISLADGEKNGAFKRIEMIRKN